MAAIAAVGACERRPSLCQNTNVAPEQELAVQIRDVDRIHVDDVNVCEAAHGQVFQDLQRAAWLGGDGVQEQVP